jgi:hypothetical protein
MRSLAVRGSARWASTTDIVLSISILTEGSHGNERPSSILPQSELNRDSLKQ